MPQLKLHDVNINYQVDGGDHRDWLVLIGGYATGHLQSWARYMPSFLERWRVLRIDSRGAGASDAPDYPYTTEMMARDVLGVMEVAGVDRAHVVGRSLGGAIAQQVALLHPHMVRSLTMTSSFARIGRRGEALVDHWIETCAKIGFPRFFEYLMTYFFTAEFYEERYPEVQKVLATLDATPRSLAGFTHTGNAVKQHDVFDRLGAIRAPTLVMCGTEDLITPPRHSEEIARRIPGAELRLIERAGHGFLTEHSQSFQLILDFLARR